MNDLFCDDVKAASHDAGGKVRLKLPSNVVSQAFFSGDQAYRYWLERTWGDSAFDQAVCFLMCNPSTADKSVDDPTVAKCRKYATAWGYTRLIVLNVMAYRATDPRELLKIADPCGRDNLDHIRKTIMREKPLLICAWGKLDDKPKLKPHEDAVIALLRQIGHPAHVLKLNGNGRPAHPLYLKDALQPQPWEPA